MEWKNIEKESKQFFTKSGRVNKRKSEDLQDDFVSKVSRFFPWVESLPEALYVVSFQIQERPLCTYCGEPSFFVSFSEGYRPYCKSCKNHFIKEQREKTMQERYGVPNASYLDSRKEVMEKVNALRKEKFASGELQPWSKGKTKKTDARIAESAKKISETKKKKFESGEESVWNKGVTKEEDERLQKLSDSLKESWVGREQTEKQKEVTKGLIQVSKRRVRRTREKKPKIIPVLDDTKTLIYPFGKVSHARFLSLLLDERGYTCKAKYNDILLPFTWKIFYKKELELWKDEQIRRKIIQNRIAYLHKREEELTSLDILRGFSKSLIHKGFSSFSPVVTKKFIQDYKITSLYDPCGGWGHRLLGAWNIDYWYNDFNQNLVVAVEDMYQTYGKDVPSGNKTFSCEDASSFSPQREFDAVFTCPPYFDTEDYDFEGDSSKLFTLYQEWLTIWWRGVIQKAKTVSSLFAYVISEKFASDMNDIIVEEGYELVEKKEISKRKKNHLSITAEENLYIFRRKK